jgi:hypothetical protein
MWRRLSGGLIQVSRLERFSGWRRFVKSKTTATAKTKCGGLSTAQQTMRLSVAPVEMTPVFDEVEIGKTKSKGNGKHNCTGNQPSLLDGGYGGV